MKKIILLINIVVACCLCFSFSAFSFDETEYVEKTKEKLEEIIDEDTADAFEYFDIDILDPNGIYNFSITGLVEYFKNDLSEKITDIIKLFISVCSFLIVASAVGAVLNRERSNSMLELLLLVLIIFITLKGLGDMINSVIAILDMGGRFMVAFIPVFASIIAFSGNVSTAVTYNTVVMGIAQGISYFLKNYGEKIVAGYLCLTVSFSLNEKINTDRFISMFSRFSTVLIGFFSTAFASVLSIRSIMSVSIDSVSAKGIKFIVSSMIPVVGSAISEAYSTLLGSIGIIKGSVAVFGIIAIIIIIFPAVIQGTLSFCALSLLSFFAEMLSQQRASTILRGFTVAIKFLLLLLIFEAFIMIISTALIINIRQ